MLRYSFPRVNELGTDAVVCRAEINVNKSFDVGMLSRRVTTQRTISTQECALVRLPSVMAEDTGSKPHQINYTKSTAKSHRAPDVVINYSTVMYKCHLITVGLS
jgi:hypothetical protein